MARVSARARRPLVNTSSGSIVKKLSEDEKQTVIVYGQSAAPPDYYRWGGGLKFSELFWDDIQAIVNQAETGRVERWADLTRHMLRSDDHLLSAYETRTATVAGGRISLSLPKVPKVLEPIAARAMDDCIALMETIPDFRRSLSDILDGLWVGYSVSEIVWKPLGDRVWIEDLVWLHPRRFAFLPDFKLVLFDQGNAAAAAAQAGLDFEPCKALPGAIELAKNKYVVFIPRVLPDYPTVSGLMMSCLRPWWIKAWALRFWLSGAEFAGNGRLVGKYPPSTHVNTRQQFFDDLGRLAAEGIGVFDSDVTLEMIQASSSGQAGSVWDTLVKWANSAFSKAALGSTLNVEVGDTGGNRALGESQGDITTFPRVQNDARRLSEVIRQQIFRPFLELNAHVYEDLVLVPDVEIVLYEDKPEVDDTLINARAVTVNELRRSRFLPPFSADQGGDDIVGAEEEKPEAEMTEPVAAADTDILPAAGEIWLDTDDGHRLEVTRVGGGKVYFVDLDGSTTARQWSWKLAYFLERARPTDASMKTEAPIAGVVLAATKPRKRRKRVAGKYQWKSMGDEKVRLLHQKLNGKIFSYDDPPVAEENGDRYHPGEKHNCRCRALPVFE